MRPDRAAWTEANQRYLMARLACVRACLTRSPGAEGESAADALAAEADRARQAMPSPAALDIVVSLFGLSPFERDVLLLCAGVELDGAFAADAGGGRFAPTFSLALSAVPGAHWSALTPAAPLRQWRLIDVGAGEAITTSPLRIDERILHFLAGISHQDDRLHGVIQIERPPADLPESHRDVARQLTAFLTTTWPTGAPTVHLGGEDHAGGLAAAAAGCADAGLGLSVMKASAVPAIAADRDRLLRLVERECLLTRTALLLQGEGGELPEAAQAFVEQAQCQVLLARCHVPAHAALRPVTVDVNRPTRDEQLDLWTRSLGSAAVGLNGALDRLVSHFDLTAPAIEAAAAHAIAHPDEPAAARTARLWHACRAGSRVRLDDLAQRIETSAGWDDLVLPPAQLAALREMAAQVRHRHRVYRRVGHRRRRARAASASARCSPGRAAPARRWRPRCIASDLQLDLYRIDLSQVVSKYIGETEKNLRRVFDAAEAGGAVLLFDEADALFGKRSEVKDSHDRYANIEVSYLLQRMEAYRGLAILTTNMKTALDDAFLRRLRFVVQFPFPDAAQRAEIWRRVFPAATPVEPARLRAAGAAQRRRRQHPQHRAARGVPGRRRRTGR